MQYVKEITLEIEYGTPAQEITYLGSLGINRLNITYAQGNKFVNTLAYYIDELRLMFTTIALDVTMSTSENTWSEWKAFFTCITQLPIDHCVVEDDSSSFASYLPEVKKIFEGAGFENYELIHFARPGHESQYMNHFWNQGVLYGYGLGAYSCIGNKRLENVTEVDQYCGLVDRTGSGVATSYTLTIEDQAREAIVLTLRRKIGIEVTSIKDKLSYNAFTHFMSIVSALMSEGLLRRNGNYIALTHKGQRVEQQIVQALIS